MPMIKICNDLIDGDFTPAYKYYFEMIMGPFKEHIQYALGRISGSQARKQYVRVMVRYCEPN